MLEMWCQISLRPVLIYFLWHSPGSGLVFERKDSGLLLTNLPMMARRAQPLMTAADSGRASDRVGASGTRISRRPGEAIAKELSV